MSRATLTVDAADEQATGRLAEALERALPVRMTVGLIGTLGAGKTFFVQRLAAAADVPTAEVQSPTFTLIHEYRARRTIFHFDAYRVRDEDEFEALGPAEYFEQPALCLVEWADRVAACLPRDRLEIRIDVTGPTERRFTLLAHGPQAADALARLERALPRSSEGV